MISRRAVPFRDFLLRHLIVEFAEAIHNACQNSALTSAVGSCDQCNVRPVSLRIGSKEIKDLCAAIPQKELH